MKIKRFLSILFALFILSISLLPVSAAEAEHSENTVTVYFDNSLTQWDTVVLYQWTKGTSCILLSPVSGCDNVYSAVIDASITDILFKNINSTSDWDFKTDDLKCLAGKIFVPTSIDNKLVLGSWQDFIFPTEPTTGPSTTEPITYFTDKQLDTLVYNSNLQTLIMLFALAISISVLVIIILYRFFQRFFYF